METTQHIATNIAGVNLLRARLPHVLIFLACLQPAAPAAAHQPADRSASTVPCAAGAVTVQVEGIAAPLAGLDLACLTRDEWLEVGRVQSVALESRSDDVWKVAVRNVSYVATFYPDNVNLRPAIRPLWYRYLHDRNEEHRVMALAAIVAIGHRDTMARLARHVRTESSPRVRRLTEAALAGYYDGRTPSEIRIDGSMEGTIASPVE